MVAATVGSGPRYAPVDPTLPPPWRALVDGNTGYIYYWNTETNVTQYEKPLPAQPPPLPAGPPPVAAAAAAGSTGPNVAVVSSTASSVGTDLQTVRTSEGRGAANGSLPASALVSPHGSGGNVQGMTGAVGHAGGGGGGSFQNNSASVAGSAGGGVSVPGTMYGNRSNNAPVHTGGQMTGSGPRSGSGMSGGTMHMNAMDKSFGSSGRHAPGSSGGIIGGVSGGNVHASAVRSAHSGNILPQPKLAALPVPLRQQRYACWQCRAKSEECTS